MVEGSGFENRRCRKATRGSNPFSSAGWRAGSCAAQCVAPTEFRLRTGSNSPHPVERPRRTTERLACGLNDFLRAKSQAHAVLKWWAEGDNVGLLDNSSLDEAPTLVMARKPLPFSAATDDRTIVDEVMVTAPKPARASAAPPRPAAAASKPPSPVASAPVSKMKTPAQPPRPTPSVPRPRSASTPPPLPASASSSAKPSRAPVPPLPAAAKRPLPPRSVAPVHASHG